MAVEPSRGEVGEVEGGRAGPADVPEAREDAAHDFRLGGTQLRRVAEAGGDQRALRPLLAAHPDLLAVEAGALPALGGERLAGERVVDDRHRTALRVLERHAHA